VKSRLNPTANGDVHIGHIYNAFVNRAMSTELDIRFDDNQWYWITRLGVEKIEEYIDRQLQDFNWMGIRFDHVYANSDQESVVRRVLAASPHFHMVPTHFGLVPSAHPIVVGADTIPMFAPAFFLTVEKVIHDHYIGVDCMVRGMELIGEDHLYAYFCGVFGYKTPVKYYIPRLKCADGSELTGISKTEGNWKVRDLREQGVSADDIHKMLKLACCADPLGSWRVENLKEFPTLIAE